MLQKNNAFLQGTLLQVVKKTNCCRDTNFHGLTPSLLSLSCVDRETMCLLPFPGPTAVNFIDSSLGAKIRSEDGIQGQVERVHVIAIHLLVKYSLT